MYKKRKLNFKMKNISIYHNIVIGIIKDLILSFHSTSHKDKIHNCEMIKISLLPLKKLLKYFRS